MFSLEDATFKKGARKTKRPCEGCSLHASRCICSKIPTLDLKTKVSLIVHHKELKRTTNTGRLAIRALKNSSMQVRGQDRGGLDLSHLLCSAYQSVLFFPAADAVELTSEWVKGIDKPIHLIVPDGNWRQASKVASRHPELSTLPRVMIRKPNLAKFHLRAETSEFGMSTLQAIAEALGVLEGPAAFERMMDLYQAKLEQTLKGRGLL